MSELSTTSSLADPSHLMPSPPDAPWNAKEMPWTVSPYNGLMEFTGSQLDLSNSNYLCQNKRKADTEDEIPSKQFITEKMVAHLNSLHISSDYIAHNMNATTESSTTVIVPSDISMDADIDYNISMSSKDLEEKLKNANRITLCEEIRKLNEDEPIIPKSLLARYDKRCTALVLWQPPQKLNNMIVPLSEKDDETEEDEEKDNNNSLNNVDLNCGMDMDL